MYHFCVADIFTFVPTVIISFAYDTWITFIESVTNTLAVTEGNIISYNLHIVGCVTRSAYMTLNANSAKHALCDRATSMMFRSRWRFAEAMPKQTSTRRSGCRGHAQALHVMYMLLR